MSTRSRSSLVSILITCGSVMRSVSTPHGMKCPQHQKTAGTFRPLERGLYAVIRALKAGERSEEDASERLEGTRPWLWTAIDPVSTLLLAHEVGPRIVALAQRVGHQVVGI